MNESIGDPQSKARKERLNRMRQKVFRHYGSDDFRRLWAESPTMAEIGYGVHGLSHYEITEEMYEKAMAECRSILARP